MMRPQRRFIMPRSARPRQPEAGREIDVEHLLPILVLHAHAPDMSRVRPALLTRMSSFPIAASASPTSFSVAAASPRSAGRIACAARPAPPPAPPAPRPACPTARPWRLRDAAPAQSRRRCRPKRRSPARSCRSDRTWHRFSSDRCRSSAAVRSLRAIGRRLKRLQRSRRLAHRRGAISRSMRLASPSTPSRRRSRPGFSTPCAFMTEHALAPAHQARHLLRPASVRMVAGSTDRRAPSRWRPAARPACQRRPRPAPPPSRRPPAASARNGRAR